MCSHRLLDIPARHGVSVVFEALDLILSDLNVLINLCSLIAFAKLLVLLNKVGRNRHSGHDWDWFLDLEIDRASFLVEYNVASMGNIRIL